MRIHTRLFIPAALAAISCATFSPPPAAAQAQSSTKTPPSKTSLKPDDVDRLLAPVALYPDQLLAQILMCATTPGEIVALNGWLTTSKALKGSQLQDAAVSAGFPPSCVALVLFPQTVTRLAEQVDWATRVGQAFTTDRTAVFASIQRLRAKARAAGTLQTTPQQQVDTRTTSGGEQVIVIEPANPQVVYVPQYNPQVVYTQPATTTVVVENSSSTDAAAAGLVGFAAGIAIGAAIDNDYYYGPYGWHGGGAYMYNEAWEDRYEAREDAREDWMDHREDAIEERGDRARTQQEQRTERQEGRQETRTQSQESRTERRTNTQASRPEARTVSQESRGHSDKSTQAVGDRSGTRSDAFSGYSSGRSERSASARGQRSRSSARSGGGRRR